MRDRTGCGVCYACKEEMSMAELIGEQRIFFKVNKADNLAEGMSKIISIAEKMDDVERDSLLDALAKIADGLGFNVELPVLAGPKFLKIEEGELGKVIITPEKE